MQSFVKVELITELLYWIALDFPGVPNKMEGECIKTRHCQTAICTVKEIMMV